MEQYPSVNYLYMLQGFRSCSSNHEQAAAVILTNTVSFWNKFVLLHIKAVSNESKHKLLN